MNIKILFFFTVFFVTAPLLTAAETMYINDRLEVTVRGGQGVEYRILTVATSNQKVDVLNIDGEYAFVRLENGIEGWMLRRYLTKDLPKPIVIANLNAELEKVKTKNSTINEELKQLREEKRVLENDKAKQQKEITTLDSKYEELKSSCADVIQLKKKHDDLKEEMKKSNFAIIELQQKNQKLQNYFYLMWFIAGATTLLIGLVLGLIMQSLRYKKRKGISF